jgi:hypothetical protein
MATQKQNNKTPFTQSITKATKIKFMQTLSRLNEVAVKHDLNTPGAGNVLDKLIDKFSESLTCEDFFPELFTGNELKAQK